MVKKSTFRILTGLGVVGAVFVFAGLHKWREGGGSRWDAVTPREEQAEKIFSALHRNIYRAFSKKSPSEIYDQLALTVEEPFLSRIYNEVYRYRTNELQGGPTVEIEEVHIRDFEQLGGGKSDRPQFKVTCSWDVLSKVTHFGHWHLRTNNYKAIYTVSLFSGQWKITEDQILWQQRIKLDLNSFKS